MGYVEKALDILFKVFLFYNFFIRFAQHKTQILMIPFTILQNLKNGKVSEKDSFVVDIAIIIVISILCIFFLVMGYQIFIHAYKSGLLS